MSASSPASATVTHAFRYREWSRPYDPRWRFITGLTDPQTILDVGCGPGWVLEQFRGFYPRARLYGVDMLDRELPGVDFHRLDLDQDSLPFPDGFFDAAICTHVVEHLRHPARAAAEIGRVLNTGGVVYFETPSARSIFAPFGLPCFWDDPTHVRPYTRNGFNSLMVDYAKLRPIRIGQRRSLAQALASVVTLPWALLRMDGAVIKREFLNLYGWSLFGIGFKPGDVGGMNDEQPGR